MSSFHLKILFVSRVLIFFMACFLLSSSANAKGGKIKGHITTLACAVQQDCPTSKQDPRNSVARDFVLISRGTMIVVRNSPGDGKADLDFETILPGTMIFLPNLPRDVKANFVRDDVQVRGDVKIVRSQFAIEVHELKIECLGGLSYKTVWTPKNGLIELGC